MSFLDICSCFSLDNVLFSVVLVWEFDRSLVLVKLINSELSYFIRYFLKVAWTLLVNNILCASVLVLIVPKTF